METECQVRFIRFSNQENGYTVFETKMDGQTEYVSCTIPNVRVGAILHLEGDFEYRERFGRTFRARSATEVVKTSEAVYNLLSSGIVKGVGPALAKRISDRFGSDTVDIMDNHIERLMEVPGIGPSALSRIRDSWRLHKDAGETLVFLQSMGLEAPLAMRIFKKYGRSTKRILEENPYCLADVWGVGFQLVDTIAKARGVEADNPRRLEAGVVQTLRDACAEGHCFLPFDGLKASVAKLLGVDPKVVRDAVIPMIRSKVLVNDGMDVYLPPMLTAEKEVALHLKRLSAKPVPIEIPKDLDEVLGLRLDGTQRRAVENMASSCVSILTGGPGTGKTTIVKGMLKVLEESGLSVALAAPTGRAAKRMAELTGHWAKTIHRLLRYKPDGGFGFGGGDMLGYDAIIVDECSMVDLKLMDSLLCAVKEGTRLVLVGDSDQLPSVGAGNVLHDLIETKLFPTTTLDTIHRQAKESRIIVNAHRANHGQDLLKGGGDFWYVPCKEELTAETVKDLVERRLPPYAKVDPLDIQVLCPTRRLCSDVNTLLQADLAKGEKVGRFHVGEKVMQIVNDYEKGVFNGDMGVLSEYDRATGMAVVDFDGEEVEYGCLELDELESAYAVTVHKSQGSEYPVVVVCLNPSDRGMLQRNLLYTALTRAKRLLVVVGDWASVQTCVSNDRRALRNSRLAERLSNAFGKS